MYNKIDSLHTERFELVQFIQLSASHFTNWKMSKIEVVATLKAQLPTFKKTDFVLIEYPQPVPQQSPKTKK